jgi:hypothetical protein
MPSILSCVPRGKKKIRTFRPALEPLEERAVPATYWWNQPYLAGAPLGLWSDQGNWLPEPGFNPGVPGVGDTAVFNRVWGYGGPNQGQWYDGLGVRIDVPVEIAHLTVYSLYNSSIVLSDHGSLQIDDGGDLAGTGAGANSIGIYQHDNCPLAFAGGTFNLTAGFQINGQNSAWSSGQQWSIGSLALVDFQDAGPGGTPTFLIGDQMSVNGTIDIEAGVHVISQDRTDGRSVNFQTYGILQLAGDGASWSTDNTTTVGSNTYSKSYIQTTGSGALLISDPGVASGLCQLQWPLAITGGKLSVRSGTFDDDVVGNNASIGGTGWSSGSCIWETRGGVGDVQVMAGATLKTLSFTQSNGTFDTAGGATAHLDSLQVAFNDTVRVGTDNLYGTLEVTSSYQGGGTVVFTANARLYLGVDGGNQGICDDLVTTNLTNLSLGGCTLYVNTFTATPPANATYGLIWAQNRILGSFGSLNFWGNWVNWVGAYTGATYFGGTAYQITYNDNPPPVGGGG